MLRFNYPIRKLSVFANIGISNGFVVSETNYKLEESVFHSNDVERAIKETRKHEQSYLYGFGTKYDKYSVEFRFEGGNGFTLTNYLQTPTKRMYFLLGYKF